MKTPDVLAAGAVVLRHTGAGPEVLMVRRPRYDDWSLPKGKLGKGETDAVCAVREVAEETGVKVHLKAPLSPHRYRVKSGLKHVDWWLAEAVGGEAGEVTGTDEVDAVAWCPAAAAVACLTYANERDRLAEALALPAVTPLLIVRHAKALPRKSWASHDSERPITDWGRRQSRSLVAFLAAFGVRRVISSSAVRCLQTLSPYARGEDLALEGWHELTEERGVRDPGAVRRAMAELADQTGRTSVAAVVCGHRPVLPVMLAGVRASDQRFATAETLIIALTSQGSPVATRSVQQRVSR